MMKRILGLFLTLTMLFTLFAATATAANPTLSSKAVTLNKAIKASNPDHDRVYGPNITYTYAVTAPSADVEGVEIEDDEGITAETKAGVLTGLYVNNTNSTTGTIAWTNTDILEASSTGVNNTKGLTIDFSRVVFPSTGVYRYKITETATYIGTGVAPNPDNVRYLDVYVKPVTTGYNSNENLATNWDIYGVRCIAYIDADNKNISESNVPPNFEKTDAFTTNDYRTYNVTVGKTLVNDPSQNGNRFPFQVDFVDSSNGVLGTGNTNFQLITEYSGNVQVDRTAQAATTTVNNTAVAANTIYKAAGTAPFSPGIANGGSVTYVGIPAGLFKVNVSESNNVSGTTYTVTATEQIGSATASDVVFDDPASSGTLSTNGKSVVVAPTQTAAYKQASANSTGNNVAIQYTNTLNEISPTGYMVRVAPYVGAVLFAGLALFVILAARKKSKKEAA